MWQQAFLMTMLYIANTSIGITNSDTKISFYTPNDGGTPRSSERINQLSLFEKKYTEYGGNIKMIVKPGVGHHPHSLEDPQPVIDFILKNMR